MKAAQLWILAAATFVGSTECGWSQASLGVANSPGFPGSTIALPVVIRRTTNVTAAQFDLAYNPAKVTAGNGLVDGVFSNHVVRTREIAPGVRRVLVFSRANAAVTVTNTRTALQIPFTVSPAEYSGSGPIVPTNAKVAQPDGTSIAPISLNAGAIFVRPVDYQAGGAQLFLPSETGVRYVIEATTNFVTWTDLSTNTAFGDFLNAFDPFATNFPYRFYRSRTAP